MRLSIPPHAAASVFAFPHWSLPLCLPSLFALMFGCVFTLAVLVVTHPSSPSLPSTSHSRLTSQHLLPSPLVLYSHSPPSSPHYSLLFYQLFSSMAYSSKPFRVVILSLIVICFYFPSFVYWLLSLPPLNHPFMPLLLFTSPVLLTAALLTFICAIVPLPSS